ncbi:MAG: hypothetical protein K6A77_03655 [Clostridiales bacterium]|nr:hypothetical protein [Clostridiales bacterium]
MEDSNAPQVKGPVALSTGAGVNPARDIIWFCHDPRFVFKGTKDMVSDYPDYWFHINGFLIGDGLALVICAVAALVVQFIFNMKFVHLQGG